MKQQLSREAFLARFGAVQANVVWAWSAVNHDDKTCYFSAWVDYHKKDENGDKYYVVQEPHWGQRESSSPGRADQDDHFNLIFNQGYSARIYFIEAVDTKSVPRSIKNTRTSFVFDADLVKTGSEIRAYPQRRIETPR